MNNRGSLNVDDAEIRAMSVAFWHAWSYTPGGLCGHELSAVAMRAAVSALEDSGKFSSETLSGRLRTAIRNAAPKPVTVPDLAFTLIGERYTKAQRDVLNAIVSGFAREKDAKVVRVGRGTYVWRERP